ncbi:glycosyltransferase family 4 protein [Polaribacter sp. BAL334]|uniref:glycosyltransferase family 4 protein n=1 Tax=Polaribacter sp. BAL334 TaxID=1708178 RepID=UPI0018D247A7|nr:glycosyltransferase family 4 protein [Polaribacter sp. BAL334]MBG7611723.1 glycosyltransferase family 4 protein [Polaribacter sp. BAL334]
MDNKKTLFYINYIPPDYGGGYLRAFKMAERFKEKKNLSGIVTLTKRNRFEKINSFISESDILFLRSKLFILFDLIYHLIKKRKSFDLIYVVSPHWHSLFAVTICKLLNKKVIIGITLMGVDSPASKSKNIFINLYYKFKNLQFKLADKIIVNSPAVLNECFDFGYTSGKVQLLVNPVDILKFKPIKSKEEKLLLRNELELPTDIPIVLFVGSVNFRKGADNFKIIFEKLNEKIDINYSFVICGDLNHKESNVIISDLKKVFENTNNQFFLYENVTCIEKFLNASDIFIFPTTNEGLPNVIIEAMAMKKIIISNTLPDITDFLLSKEFLVTDNDTNEYVYKLEKYIREPESVEQIIELNYLRIKNEFTFEKIDNQFQKLIP